MSRLARALAASVFAGASLIAIACGTPPTPAPPPLAITAAPEGGAPVDAAAPIAFVPSDAPQADPRIARMLTRVSRTRELQAKHAVPGTTLGRDALIARVRAHVEKEVPHQAIVDEGLFFQLLGVVPAPYDYEKAMFSLLQAQLAGYYEPADGTMYMAQDLEDDLADATLSHELVHALQDQHWDLKTRSKYAAGQSDLQVATSALAEGDATSTMIDVSLASMAGAMGGPRSALDIPAQLFDQVVRGSLQSGAAGTGNAPHVMVAGLVAPYVDGTAFVNELRRRGGWAMVDQAWADAPKSTEQVLHVDKWVAHEAPVTVAAPPFASLGAGWTSAATDTTGELGLRVLAEEWMPHPQAAQLAAGWGGDRSVLVKNGEQVALAIHVRWDAAPGPKDDALAAAAFDALVKATIKTKDPVPCLARSDRGPFAIGRKGRDVVIVAGPAKATATAWSSAGDCALARKWVAEVLK